MCHHYTEEYAYHYERTAEREDEEEEERIALEADD